MADYKYAYDGKQENIAKAVIIDAAISTKTAIEMSNFLRGKSTKAAKAALARIMEKKQALPFKRFTNGLGHKKGPMGAGRYPQKASEAFLGLIENAEANASNKGLADDLIIKHLVANRASTPYHYGRQRRRKMKRTHVEIVLIEDEKAAAKPKKAKASDAQNTVKQNTVKQNTVKQNTVKQHAEKQHAEASKAEHKPVQESVVEEQPVETPKVAKPKKAAKPKKQSSESPEEQEIAQP